MNEIKRDENSLQQKPPHEERLQIVHLLFWTATTAVVLGLDRATREPSNGELGVWPLIFGLSFAPLVGAGVAAWLLTFWRIYTDGPRFPSQPGHWLLLLVGIGGVVQMLVRAMISLSAAGTASLEAFLAIRLFGSFAAMAVYFFAVADARGIWRAVFWLGLISNFLSLVATCLQIFRGEAIMAWLLTGIILIAVVADIRSRTRRDYLHWLGVFVRIAYLALLSAIPYLIHWLQRSSVTP